MSKPQQSLVTEDHLKACIELAKRQRVKPGDVHDWVTKCAETMATNEMYAKSVRADLDLP
jgi:hypothetical protein